MIDKLTMLRVGVIDALARSTFLPSTVIDIQVFLK